MSAIVKRITELVEEKIADAADLFIVDIKVLPNNKVIILIDGDNGITIQKCAEVSRHVGFHLEEEDVIDHAYTLEVSSPGVDFPLKSQRQFAKNIGRTVAVKFNDGTKKEGKLLGADESGIKIEETIKEKGKKSELVETEYPFSQIGEIKVTISFK
jgi:ribosome maturation factor RimP